MRVTILLKQRDESSARELAPTLHHEQQRLGALGVVQSARWGTAVDPFPDIAHGHAVTARFEAFLEFWTEGDDCLPNSAWTGLDSLADRFSPHADAEASAIVVSKFHPIIPGTPNYLLTYALRRPSDMEPKAFYDYWLTTHSQDAIDHAAAPGGYSQLHAEHELTADAGKITGFGITDFDGICEAGHLELETFTRFMNGKPVAKGGIRLEEGFIDHSRSALGLMSLQH